MGIAEHGIDPGKTRIPVHGAADGRHGMTVDQQTATEFPVGFLDQRLKGLMVGLVIGFNTPFRLSKGEFFLIDLLAAGHHTGDGAEPGADAR